MTVEASSFYAARGDLALRGMNFRLETLGLAREDYVGLKAARQNDGVWLTFLHRANKRLRLESSSFAHGSWFHQDTAPTEVELVFNVPVSEDSIVDGALKWVTATMTTNVLASAITISEFGRKLTFAVVDLTSYTGPVTLSIDQLTNDENEELETPIALSFQVTPATVALPKPGDREAPTATQLRGLMTIGRVVSAHGMSTDLMLKSYLHAQDLENSDLLDVVQVPGPNGSVELFVLAWKSRSPSVKSTAPLPNATIAEESAPTQILLEFDQAVAERHLTGQDGTDRVFYDGTPIQDLAGVTFEQVDARGMQWLVKSTALFASVGNHVLIVRGIPDRFGERPGGSYIIPWQVLPLIVVGATTYAQCEDFIGDGLQTAFPLLQTPLPCTLQVFVQGVFRHPDCYTVVGPLLTFATAPFNLADIRVMYRSTSP